MEYATAMSLLACVLLSTCTVAQGHRANPTVPDPVHHQDCLTVPDPAYTGVLARIFYKAHIENFIEHGNTPMCAGSIHYMLSSIDGVAPIVTFGAIAACLLVLARTTVLWTCYAADVADHRYGHIWIVRAIARIVLKLASYANRFMACCGCGRTPKQKKLA